MPAANIMIFSRKRLVFGAVLLVVVFSYIVTYWHLSRRGLEVASTIRLDGFVYSNLSTIISDDKYSAAERKAEWVKHVRLRRVFYMAWFMDHVFFGTSEPLQHEPLVNLQQLQTHRTKLARPLITFTDQTKGTQLNGIKLVRNCFGC